MKKDRKRLHFEKNIRFRERMLLIYIIGGIIPFIGTSMYTSYQMGNTMVNTNKEAQKDAVSLLSLEIDNAIPVAERIADRLFADEDLYRIIQTEYEKETDLEKDQTKLEEIETYQIDHAENISDITIYVKNSSICSESLFAYLDNDMMATEWYSATCMAKQEVYWGYVKGEEKNYMQLSRLMEDEAGELVGVLTIRLNTSRLEKLIDGFSTEIMLLLNDQNTIFSNFQIENDNDFLLERLRSLRADTATLSVSKSVEEYLLTYQRIYPGLSDSYYTVISVRNSQQIKGGLNRINLNTYLITFCSLFVSVLMIIWFSNAYGARLKMLRRQMHLVANGRYQDVEPIVGNDEIAEIYQEVEKMMGDIQDLTSNMVEEKVQKEKLHTRQKEVEFKMLASQINPHFLYNTLETIRMKARVNQQGEIEDLVKMLAKIMRRNIQVSNQMVSLKSEIELTENYLKIQNYRFGDRIKSEMHVDNGIDLEMEVMPLIIQPFVENAFVHGLEAMSGAGQLTIEITQNEADVIIQITDNGVGMPYYKLGELRHILNTGENIDQTHIGINNVNQRLKLQYGEEYGIDIESRENNGTTIEIHIPKNP